MNPIDSLRKSVNSLDSANTDSNPSLNSYLVATQKDGGFGVSYHYEDIQSVNDVKDMDEAVLSYYTRNKIGSKGVKVLCKIPKGLANDTRLESTAGLYKLLHEIAIKGIDLSSLKK